MGKMSRSPGTLSRLCREMLDVDHGQLLDGTVPVGFLDRFADRRPAVHAEMDHPEAVR